MSLTTLALTAGAQALAQDALHVAVLLPMTATEASTDSRSLERQVLQAWERDRARQSLGVEVHVLEHEASVPATLAAAEEAVRDGAHLIVCCRDAETSRQVASQTAEWGVPLLSLHPTSVRSAAGWHVAVGTEAAEELRAIIGDAYARGARTFGMMMPAGPEGDALLARLPGYFGAPGMTLATPARYEPGASVLTPEALWVATRLPDVVIAWGDGADPLTALWGLRDRGWRGPVYLPSAVLPSLADRPAPPTTTGEVRTMAPPSSVWTFLPRSDPSYDAVLTARAWGAGRLASNGALADGARLHDALRLLDEALAPWTSAAWTGVSLDEVRLALADALTSLPALDLATGRYDPDPRIPAAGRAAGLRPVRIVNGRLQPLVTTP